MLMINEETRRFIDAHLGGDPVKLRLKYAGKRPDGVDLEFALTQIEARRKTSGKLPEVLKCADFVFPTLLASEQCTSEELARFHVEIAGRPGSMLDMTCGLGIDAMAFASAGWRVTACDISEVHTRAMQHNAAALGIEGVDVRHQDSLVMLSGNVQHYDMIFADPARRGEHNKRLYGLADCSPDVVGNLDVIKSHTDTLMVKASPMLDVKAVCRELPGLTDVWILSVRNECKEIVCICKFDKEQGVPEIHAVNFASDGTKEFLTLRGEREAEKERFISSMEEIGQWIYIPNASVMKVINQVSLSAQFPGLLKLDANSHIYTSEEELKDFPGRRLKIDKLLPYNKKGIKGLRGGRFNLVARNFPDSPGVIVKKTGIKEGGEAYLIATSTLSKPILILTLRHD